MGVEPLTPDVAEQLGLPRSTQGLVVGELDPSGIAADSGIQEGDVIQKVDGKPVTSVEQLKSALDRKDGKASMVLINRKGANVFVALRAN